MTEAFSAPGRFYRGNIHTHSTRSDGKLDPQDVCARYREAGYDFICLSDHFLPQYGFPVVDTAPYRTRDFTTIFGAEIHAPANSHGEAWHILAAGLPLDFAPTAESETGVALAARAKAAGAFVGIAHPQWSGLTGGDGLSMAPHAHAVEIYNHGCNLECRRGDGTYLLDQLLSDGSRLLAYAADDAHFRFPDAFGGWMMVKAEANESEALVAAMKAGRFYSSQGPVIEAMEVGEGAIAVACSPAENIALVGRGSRATHRFGPEQTLATLPTSRFLGDWCRVVVTDEEGNSAWSNPIWL